MRKVVFLGTGLNGAALAEAAVDRGLEVTVWNRTRDKAEAVAGATVADTPADAVRGAERVHLVLTDDAVVDAVLAQCGDALDSALVVDHSTTGPAPTAARAERLAARGVRYLHAPVFMSPQMCRLARGLMLVAGPETAFREVEGALSAMTSSVRYLGEDARKAAAFKLFGNAMLFFIVQGLADVFTLARNLGIDAEEARGLFDSFNPTGTLQNRGAKMARGDFSPSFELTMARKDARLMLEAGGAGRMPGLEAIAARMDALIERGLGDADLGVLAVDAVDAVDAD